jgi:hypothetical protein
MRTVLVVPALILLSASSSRPFEMRMVEYDVDGTAKYANVTFTNGSGSTEQKQVKFPHHDSFPAAVGVLAYVEAQKVKVTAVDKTDILERLKVLADGASGTVHVVIHINSQVRGEATSDAPFGIAKVSAKVE